MKASEKEIYGENIQQNQREIKHEMLFASKVLKYPY